MIGGPGEKLAALGSTRRRADGMIETSVSGVVTHAIALEFIAAFRRMGGAKIWIFFGEEVTAYDPKAAAALADAMKDFHRTMRLRHVVAALGSPIVRMGARTVALLARVDIRIVADAEAAEKAVRELR